MFQVGIPGGPELVIIFVLLLIAFFGLLAVLAVVGVVAFLMLRSGSEPDESGWDTGEEADREPPHESAERETEYSRDGLTDGDETGAESTARGADR